jgi:protein-arginine kinase activator protein McsA
MQNQQHDHNPVCNNCGSTRATYAGVQWFPQIVVRAQYGDACTVTDAERPEQAGLHAFTCDNCHTTYLLPPIATTGMP